MQDMTRNLRYLFVLLFVSIAGAAFGQAGEISGTVYDEKKEPIIGAVVQVFQAGVQRGGDVTNEDGKYSVKPLSPAQDYEVRVKYTGYKEIQLRNIRVTAGVTTYHNFNMEVSAKELAEVVVKEYTVPLINKGEPGTTTTFTSKEIEKLPTRATNDMASLAGGAYQSKAGATVSIAGARSNGTLYIVDGVQVNGVAGTNFPPGSIDQISVITSGIPARYGDASGGVISITTKGPSAKTRGEIGAEHSIDGYNHNLLYFNVTGPLIKQKIDSVNKKSVLGYSLSGQYLYDEDNNPTYDKNYVVKADKLAQIQNQPLVLSVTSSGAPVFRSATEFVRLGDLETQKKRVSADYNNARLVGRVDYQLSDNMNLGIGGNVNFVRTKRYTRSYTLFAPQEMPQENNTTGRGFVRFTQKFGKVTPGEEGQERKTALISNVFYQLQADYQVTNSTIYDPKHKYNIFDYGYVGKFRQNTTPFYAPGTDSLGNTGIIYVADVANSVSYERSDLNPLRANYTSQIFNFTTPNTLNTLQQLGGLRNGDNPITIYNLWLNAGNSIIGYRKENEEQFAFSVDASLDLQPRKTRHAIEFGLYYQQRSERRYDIGSSFTGGPSIWSQMRLLTNRHLASLDYANPIWVINGQRYTKDQLTANNIIPGPNDTIVYNRRVDTSFQTAFDYNLRNALGMNPYGTELLEVDNMDPSRFSLDLFSADDIINQGNSIASYYGYDYKGNRLNRQVNFNDWFTKKDANGNFTREIGAFRPNYIAGYISDRFEFPNGTLFNLGVRVERFDANTKVLKDPYSLFAVHTVASSDAQNSLNGNTTPANIGSDYVVYVKDNNSSTPEVIGYRNGDDWYDPFGKFIQDPSTLKTYSDGRDPQPYLQKNNASKTRALTMRDEGYDPNTSFTDYTPQVNVMPRISFTFPIADQSMFYAHYDILVQRPKSVDEIFASPADYYYISQNSNSTIRNPNLKPEKVFDYELGFQQVLSRNSAITITGYYKERKDMIQVRPYLYAWPNTYWTFGNRDFSTTKGMILKYDLRRINHLQMQLSYTLQFAEGTGSSSNSGSRYIQSLSAAGQPNLRFALPLTIDSRHQINASIDYRYDRGEGPVIADKHLLQNAGLNLVFRTRSGEPYTKYVGPSTTGLTEATIAGGAQGSRLPWHYMMDLRIDKTFDLAFGKKSSGINKSSRFGLTAFMYIQNLLNTRDVLGVYGFTGRPDDDGYLATEQGQLEASIKVDPQAYTDLYRIGRNNPNNLNNPRRVNLGVSFNF